MPHFPNATPLEVILTFLTEKGIPLPDGTVSKRKCLEAIDVWNEHQALLAESSDW